MNAALQREPQLGLFQEKPQSPNVQWLEDLLREHKEWMTAAEIVEAAHGRISDRDVRALASASAWILSGPGSPGYKHLECSTPEENHHYTEAGLSQGKHMIKRALRLRRNAHRRIG